jgi:signal transduction histidine kinase
MHGEVRLTARDLGDEVEIAVSDTGIGIAPEDQQRLFEPFVRLDSHLRIKAGGTGLGLYLTRKILLEILRGTLSVSSEKGRGSTFALRIPKQLPVPAAGGQKGGAGQHETRPGH